MGYIKCRTWRAPAVPPEMVPLLQIVCLACHGPCCSCGDSDRESHVCWTTCLELDLARPITTQTQKPFEDESEADCAEQPAQRGGWHLEEQYLAQRGPNEKAGEESEEKRSGCHPV